MYFVCFVNFLMQERNERVKSVNMEFAENELNKKKRELLTVAYEVSNEE